SHCVRAGLPAKLKKFCCTHSAMPDCPHPWMQWRRPKPCSLKSVQNMRSVHRVGRKSRPTHQTQTHRLFAKWACKSDAKRSEEHTSELQSRENLVCRLLLEKKK